MLMTSFIEDLRPLVQVVKCCPPTATTCRGLFSPRIHKGLYLQTYFLSYPVKMT